jgi:hypothetical protein
MSKRQKKVLLARETLLRLDQGRKPGGPDGPVGTEPNSDLPDNTCITLSCHHC